MPYYHIQLPEFRKKYKSFESVKGEPFLTWLYLLDEAYKNEDFHSAFPWFQNLGKTGQISIDRCSSA